jgi:ATP-dependent exoDNAse (exonuclease V) alpha subunit
VAAPRRPPGIPPVRLRRHGKTTLAKHIAEGVDGEVVFGAYTGKAALVLRSRGCTDASTIHSLIYRSREGDENGPQFVLNRSSSAAKADLIIIDECSMVDEELGRDLLSFGRPVSCSAIPRNCRRSKAAASSPKPSPT